MQSWSCKPVHCPMFSHFQFILLFSFQLGHVGSASLNTVAMLLDLADNDKVLATNVNTVVCVSKQTRAPVALPEWWTKKYAAQADGEKVMHIYITGYIIKSYNAVPNFNVHCLLLYTFKSH